jgi:hypothetical protein
MNQEDGGFDCPGCAWPDDPSGLKLDICENGFKHVTWELERKQVGGDFFAAHTVSELAGWSDYDLEAAGRLSEPMRYDAANDRYVPVSWEDAFELVGSTLRGLDSPHQAAFYTSGRLSNEATFLYQLWVREFGTNNLPDCSNMCHEASGVAMTSALGPGKGTVDLHDWEQTDAIWLMGDNAATNTPRMLTWLAEADRRGAAPVHINPLIEAAARRTIVPRGSARPARWPGSRRAHCCARSPGPSPPRWLVGDTRGKGLPAVRLASIAATSFRDACRAWPAADRDRPFCRSVRDQGIGRGGLRDRGLGRA